MSWILARMILTIASVGGLLLSSASAQAQNLLKDLGAVAPGLGINNSGEVVLQNYIYSQGTLTALPHGFTGAAINANGEVAGTLPAPPSDLYFQSVAAIYANGTVTAIPDSSFFVDVSNPVGACYIGTGINDSGTVIGWYDIVCNTTIPSQPPGGWAFSKGVVSNIDGPCNGPTIPQAINDSGQITGTASTCPNGSDEGFLYEQGEFTYMGPGSAPGYAINASGQVTGGQGATGTGGFLYSNGHVTLLPGHVGSGLGINASGFIVGDGVNGQPHAYYYNGVTTTDLNTLIGASDPLQPYVTLTDARGINDGGLVIVNGVDARDNSQHAYLLQVQMSVAPNTGDESGGKSGGGAFDLLSLAIIFGTLALHRRSKTRQDKYEL